MSRSRRGSLDKRQPQPPRGRESRSPRAPKNKRHKTNANATTQWPKGEDEHPRRAEAPERQKTTTNHIHWRKKNTPACRRPWASTNKHQQRWPATKDPCHPQPPGGRKTQQKGQDHQNFKTKGTPGGEQKPQTAVDKKRETQKQHAESQEQSNARQQLTGHCHSCTGVGEGIGVHIATFVYTCLLNTRGRSEEKTSELLPNHVLNSVQTIKRETVARYFTSRRQGQTQKSYLKKLPTGLRITAPFSDAAPP